MQTAANLAQRYLNQVPIDTSTTYKGRDDGSKMKALAWMSSNKVELIEVPVPDITDPDDVIVKVTGTTICGSDLHLYHGEVLALHKGDILGHEFMGRVDRVGPNVSKFKEGDRVVVSAIISCGKCEYCQQKLTSCCERTNKSPLMNSTYGHRMAGIFGFSHLSSGFAGGQAEYVRVPFGEVNLLPIPDKVTDEQALYLSDILPTSYHAVVDTGVKKGDTVGIWGLGPVGQYAARWALLKGAKRVIGIDKEPKRLGFAASDSVDVIDINKHNDVVKRLQELVPGGLDVAIDCGTFHEPKTLAHKAQKAMMLETDSPEILNEMIMSVKKMGRCGVINAYAGHVNGFNIGALMEKGIRFIGNGQCPMHKYWETILNEYIVTGKFDPTFIITHRVPIDDMVQLYDAFDKRLDGVVKVFVETQFSSPPSNGCPKTSRVSEWSN